MDVRFPDGRHLIAVADGMGGHSSGEVASALATEVLCREIGQGRSLPEAFAIANAEIHDESLRDPARAGMGTTLVALLRKGSVYEIANVGDSRAYRVDRHGILQITRDHSFAAEAASNNIMSPEEIARSPWRNALTRSLGTQAAVDVDLFGPFEIPGPSHIVLLCSDGVYRVISDEAMRQVLLSTDDVAGAAREISSRALGNRSDDNISVAVLEFGGMLVPQREAAPKLKWTDLPPLPATVTASAPAPAALPAEEEVPVPMHQAAAATAFMEAAPPALSLPRWLRKGISVAVSDNTMFALTVAILLIWLVVHLIARG